MYRKNRLGYVDPSLIAAGASFAMDLMNKGKGNPTTGGSATSSTPMIQTQSQSVTQGQTNVQSVNIGSSVGSSPLDSLSGLSLGGLGNILGTTPLPSAVSVTPQNPYQQYILIGGIALAAYLILKNRRT